MNFSFTGKIALNAMDSKNPWIREGKDKTDKPYKTLNLSVVQANSRGYCELFANKRNPIITFDNDSNKIEIDWEDRMDPDVVKSVASFRKHTIRYNSQTANADDGVIKTNEIRKEFITDWDFVNYFVDHHDELKDKRLTVTGQVNKNFYKGKVTDRFQINNIFEAKDADKDGLRITGEFFFNKESFDMADWKEEKKLYINGYVPQYINKDEGTKYVEQQIIFDCSKVDWDNEKHVKIVQYKLKQIGCTYEDGKVKCSLKSGYYAQNVICNYVNGAEEIEFSMDTLTPNQKEAIELGIKKLEDFRPRGSIFGTRITQYKLINFDSRELYADGYVKLDDTVDEFEEKIYVAPVEESLDDVMKKAEEKKEDKAPFDEDEIDEDDIFS